MEQKTVVVSGAKGNLGYAVSEHFLHIGYRVVGIVHKIKPSKDTNPNYIEMEADLSRQSAAELCADEIIHRFEEIETAVLTVGGFAMGTLASTDEETLEKFLRLNFYSAYHLARQLVKQFQKQGRGTLFFVGSQPGMDTSKATKTVAYSLSKSLLFQLANIINAENKNSNIRAYVIVPGTIDTPQNRKAMPEADYSNWQDPKEIASLIGKFHSNYSSEKSIVEVEKERKFLRY